MVNATVLARFGRVGCALYSDIVRPQEGCSLPQGKRWKKMRRAQKIPLQDYHLATIVYPADYQEHSLRVYVWQVGPMLQLEVKEHLPVKITILCIHL